MSNRDLRFIGPYLIPFTDRIRPKKRFLRQEVLLHDIDDETSLYTNLQELHNAVH